MASQERVGCIVVGAGPAGMILSYLLARAGIEVVLLEMHADFDREFRGDTFHGSTMRLMADLGLAEKVEAILHSKLKTLYMVSGAERFPFVDLGALRPPYNYVGLVPQARFLDLMVAEARRFPTFRIEMEATARELLRHQGRVVGVEYRQNGATKQLFAPLVVAADGRASRIRRVAEIDIDSPAPPMDVLWFTLPKAPGDESIDALALRFGPGKLLISIDRHSFWQLGYIICKGSASELRSQGLEKLRQEVASLIPPLAGRLDTLRDWKDIAVLAVQTGCVKKWYKPGLLLIGDAAHIMSPIGGVGINYAVMDAVAAANLLAGPLREGRVGTTHLALVQARREFPTRVIQRVQALIQNRIVAQALASDRPFRPPRALRALGRLPWIRKIPPYLIGFGIRPERLRLPALTLP